MSHMHKTELYSEFFLRVQIDVHNANEEMKRLTKHSEFCPIQKMFQSWLFLFIYFFFCSNTEFCDPFHKYSVNFSCWVLMI